MMSNKAFEREVNSGVSFYRKSSNWFIDFLSTFPFLLLSPALTLYIGLKNGNVQFKKWLTIAFVTLYGSIIIISETNDGHVHWTNVYDHYINLDFNQFLSELSDILLFETNEEVNEDVYIHILSFFTGTILQLPELFFVFVSFVYSFFFSGSLFKIIKLLPKVRYSWLLYGLIIVLVLWKSIEGINTVRTWTGLWVLMYGALSYFEKKEKKYLILLALPPFIHVGYFLMAIPAWIVIIFGVKPKLYAILFFLSFTSNLIPENAVLSRLQQFEVGQEKIEGYYSGDNPAFSDGSRNATAPFVSPTQNQATGGPWYLQLYNLELQDRAVEFLATVLLIFGMFRFMTSLEASLFSIGLLTKVLSNGLYFLFAVENRTAIISGLFILATLVLLGCRGIFQNKSLPNLTILKWMLFIGLFMLMPFVFYRLADMIYFISVYILFFPFIPWISEELNMSIRQTVGKLLGV